MGCDIHMWAEYYKPSKKKWFLARNPVGPCSYCEGTGKGYKSRECYFCKGSGRRRSDFYEGRCYDDFAILADVRNGRGFAGIKTGEGFVPISEPRGVPKDATEFFKNRVKEYALDWHSHSYLTLQDLMEFDWQQYTSHEGIVSAIVYNDWVTKRARKGPPITWSGDISGKGVSIISEAKLAKKIANGEIKIVDLPDDPAAVFKLEMEQTEGKTYYTRIRWTESYKDSAHNLWLITIPRLQTFAEKKKLKPHHLRICFFFDN